jgi:hypothetical protein
MMMLKAFHWGRTTAHMNPHALMILILSHETNSPPTLVGVGHQWTVSTSTTYNQWFLLAKSALTMSLVGRNRSLVADTNLCGWALIQEPTHTPWTPSRHPSNNTPQSSHSHVLTPIGIPIINCSDETRNHHQFMRTPTTDPTIIHIFVDSSNSTSKSLYTSHKTSHH